MKHLKYLGTFLLLLGAYGIQAQEVRISNGINVSLDGPVHLVLNGMGLTNGGQFKAESGTVLFTGTAVEGRAFIRGSNPIIFHNLTIDRSSGDLQLENRAFVYGKLNLQQGNLDLNNNSIDLGSTGTVEGETRMARITGKNGGYIKVTTDLTAPQTLNPGNLGLQLTTSNNMGRTTIVRGHLQQMNDNGQTSIQRYYEIDPTYASDLNAAVVANFLDVETGNLNTNEIALWSSKDGGRKWTSVERNSNSYVVSGDRSSESIRLTYFLGRAAANHWSGGANLQLYPNPVTEKFTLSFNYPRQEEMVIDLYNSSGQLLESRRIKTFDGLNKIDWQVGKYPGGNYQLRFAGQKLNTVTFTKQ